MRSNYLGLSHVALRVTDLAKSRAFYVDLLGFQPISESKYHFISNVHGSLIGILSGAPETQAGDTFNPFRVGLDHVALAVPNRKALEKLKTALDTANVRNNGIQHDSGINVDYISFYDPDGIAWEFYIMPLPIRLALWLSGLLGFKIPTQG